MLAKLFQNKKDKQINYDSRGGKLNIGDKQFSLGDYRDVVVVCCGENGYTHAGNLFFKLHERINRGIAISHSNYQLPKIQCFAVSALDTSAMTATDELVKMLSDLNEETLVIFALSRGAEGMLCLPSDRNVQSKIKILASLRQLGANPNEINTVNKHISLVKGGQLAQIVYPAQVINLIYQHPAYPDFALIGAGPTIKDETTLADAQTILKRYDALEHAGVLNIKLVETPKEDKYFEKVHNIII